MLEFFFKQTTVENVETNFTAEGSGRSGPMVQTLTKREAIVNCGKLFQMTAIQQQANRVDNDGAAGIKRPDSHSQTSNRQNFKNKLL